jgi:hypothetical protein
MPAAPPKGIDQPSRQLVIHGGRVVGVLEQEMAMRCQAQLKMRHDCRAMSKKSGAEMPALQWRLRPDQDMTMKTRHGLRLINRSRGLPANSIALFLSYLRIGRDSLTNMWSLAIR